MTKVFYVHKYISEYFHSIFCRKNYLNIFNKLKQIKNLYILLPIFKNAMIFH